MAMAERAARLVQALLRNKGMTRQVTVPVSAGLLTAAL
jgi:hypothetical protein